MQNNRTPDHTARAYASGRNGTHSRPSPAGNHSGRKPHRRPRRRRRSDGSSFLLVVALILGLGMICVAGAKSLWTRVEARLPDGNTGAAIAGQNDLRNAGEDWLPPVIDGVEDLTVYQGDSVAYLAGVTVTDPRDPAPSIRVDTDGVDLSRPGVYTVTYFATNAGGQTTQAQATVTVLEKGENYVDLDTIYQAADAKLAQIIRENATVKQQVHDIYAYARLNLTYGGHSDRTDWRQTAYTMLTEGKGDCFGFFAVTKLLFERLGIPNIDVRKVKNSSDDSDHFWSLVSLDGGVTWYHFDSTPRAGDGDDFCLVTDAFLDAYSDAHDGSHNRDRSLYPATP